MFLWIDSVLIVNNCCYCCVVGLFVIPLCRSSISHSLHFIVFRFGCIVKMQFYVSQTEQLILAKTRVILTIKSEIVMCCILHILIILLIFIRFTFNIGPVCISIVHTSVFFSDWPHLAQMREVEMDEEKKTELKYRF